MRHHLSFLFIGLLVFIGTYFCLLGFVSPVFAQETKLDPITGLPGGYQGKELSDAPTTMELLISNVVGFLTVCAGLEFAIYMILAGLTWITAREESSRLSKAKDMFVNALIGLAFVVGAWAFTGVMQTVFGFDILSPASIIENYLTPNGKGEGRGGKAASPAPCLNFDEEGDVCLD